MAAWNAIQWPVEKMRKWYEVDGLSVTQIGKKLKRSPKLVWKVCKKHGFRMRPVGSNPGSKNPAWRGGRIVDKCGYVLIHMPHHPHANSGGYVREHRLVAERVLGRYLTATEVVHHKDDDPGNNDPGNLVVYETNGVHLAATIKGQIPAWSDDGRRNIDKANREKGGDIQLHPIDWPSDVELRKLHHEQLLSLPKIAKRIGCGAKRLADRMHYRNIPIRYHKSVNQFVPRRHVLPTASVLSPKELDDFRSRGIAVHLVECNGKRRQSP